MTDEMEEYLQHAKETLEPMVRDSAIMVTIWSGEIDPKIALETGYAVLLDKPFVIVAKPGQHIPENLRRLAMEVVEGDLSTDQGKAVLAEGLAAITKDEAMNDRIREAASKIERPEREH